MKPVAWLYIGLSGSGKTYQAKKLFERLRKDGLDYILIDDPKNKSDINPYLGRNLIICDPHLCVEKNRKACIDTLEKYNYTILLCYFENDRVKCQKNIDFRNDGRVINLKGQKYDLPRGLKTNKIWQNEIH